jgi:hypothetical protein
VRSLQSVVWLSGFLAMEAYKTQLRQHLADHGWEVVEVLDSDVWWADEYWKVESRRNLWGFEIVVTFLVDPMWEGPRKKGQAVWAIAATEGIPTERLSAGRGIGQLCLVKGRFDENLREFVISIDAYRNDREQTTEGRA